MNIQTTVHGEMHGLTWEGYPGSLPFTLQRDRRVTLSQQLRRAVGGDFQKETVRFSGAAHITVTKRKGHTYAKHVPLESLPSLKSIVLQDA